MQRISLAGLAGLAAIAAHAQQPQSMLHLARQMDSMVVTATRTQTAVPSLRDTVVVTREELDALNGLSLAEVLQLRAGVEYRATGGPGQPTGLFVRGAGAAQTLVLIDGLRVGSATTGATAVEAIPVELIERIEVVKGAMSSLYGSDAIGGVIHIFTRGKRVPHLFASASYGSHDDQRVSAGIATSERTSHVALNAGARRVEAPSATNSRAPSFVFDPDRDPHENVFANLRASQRLWQGETLTLEAFGSRSRTHYDGGGGPGDRNEQRLAGARLTSASDQLLPGVRSRISFGHSRDELRFFPGDFRFETQQDQATWINETGSAANLLVFGAEAVRQRVQPDRDGGVVVYTRNRRHTYSGFVSANARLGRQQAEVSTRYDDDEQFGSRTTGSASYGVELGPALKLALTLSRGFRAPTFNDLYLTLPPFYQGNPDLRPERSRATELSLRGGEGSALRWRVTGFDNRLSDLIVATEATVLNVNRARVRGVEACAEATWLSTQWRGQVTLQRPRDEDTGRRLQGRAEVFGALEASRGFGPVTASAAVIASGDRYDGIAEGAPRLPGYATMDLRVRYRFPKHWSVELAATNLADRHYESARGYDAPRRAVMLTVRFDAF